MSSLKPPRFNPTVADEQLLRAMGGRFDKTWSEVRDAFAKVRPQLQNGGTMEQLSSWYSRHRVIVTALSTAATTSTASVDGNANAALTRTGDTAVNGHETEADSESDTRHHTPSSSHQSDAPAASNAPSHAVQLLESDLCVRSSAVSQPLAASGVSGAKPLFVSSSPSSRVGGASFSPSSESSRVGGAVATNRKRSRSRSRSPIQHKDEADMDTADSDADSGEEKELRKEEHKKTKLNRMQTPARMTSSGLQLTAAAPGSSAAGTRSTFANLSQQLDKITALSERTAALVATLQNEIAALQEQMEHAAGLSSAADHSMASALY